jgi:hypothetical protein
MMIDRFPAQPQKLADSSCVSTSSIVEMEQNWDSHDNETNPSFFDSFYLPVHIEDRCDLCFLDQPRIQELLPSELYTG